MQFIEKDKTGRQFAVSLDQQLVAVVGVVFETSEHPYCVVTDVAIHPNLRRQGLASKTIVHLTDQVMAEVEWRCYVEIDNQAARKMFEKIGWKIDDRSCNGRARDSEPNDDDMICMNKPVAQANRASTDD